MWQQWRSSVRLEKDSVHLVVWSLPAEAPETPLGEAGLACLSVEERARAARFVFDRHRRAYVAAHAGLRRVLASYLECLPAALCLGRNARGKPELVSPQLRFNLSHTDGICALAICGAEDEVGVDVERLRPVDPQIARQHFAPGEQVQLGTLAGEAWIAGFFRCWTRKEALLKAEGFGLHAPLDSFRVTLLPEEPPALLSYGPESGFGRHWQLHHFEPEQGVVGALAVASQATPLLLRLAND